MDDDFALATIQTNETKFALFVGWIGVIGLGIASLGMLVAAGDDD